MLQIHRYGSPAPACDIGLVRPAEVVRHGSGGPRTEGPDLLAVEAPLAIDLEGSWAADEGSAEHLPAFRTWLAAHDIAVPSPAEAEPSVRALGPTLPPRAPLR